MDITKLTNLVQSMKTDAAAQAGQKPSFRRAPTGPASAGTAHVYYRSGDERVYLGTVDNKAKLVFFSRTASDQLIKANFEANKIVYVNKVRGVTVNKVDDAAGRIVFNWINTNNMHNPQPLTFAHLGKNNQFLDGCKLHHASHQFHLTRELRGEDIRERIFWYLRGSRKVKFEDFVIVFEWLSFDTGLIMEMKRKVAYHTIKGWISEEVRGKLMEWCVESDATKGTTLVQQMAEVETQVRAEMDAAEERREQQVAAATTVDENLVFVHESIAGKANAGLTAEVMSRGGSETGEGPDSVSEGTDKGKAEDEVETAKSVQGARRLSYAKILRG